jgi:hypothetical protein
MDEAGVIYVALIPTNSDMAGRCPPPARPRGLERVRSACCP